MHEGTRLRLFDLTMIVVGLVVGMGIFRTSRDAASSATDPFMYFAVWVVGGLIALCGALTYAEIGSRFPVTGGFYRVFSYAYHPSLAFALNISILISNASSIGAVALIGAEYVLPLFTETHGTGSSQLVAIMAIIVFFFINLKGLRVSSTTQNILMLVKIGMLLLVISGIFFPGVWADRHVIVEAESTSVGSLLSAFGTALVAVSFTYGGYQQTINFGHEVSNAQRNVPRGILLGMVTIIVLYMLTNLSYYLVIGFTPMKTTSEIASVVVSKLLGERSAQVFAFFLFLSVLAYVNVNLLSNPRVMYAMSKDGVLPARFGQKNEKDGTYGFSLMVYAIVSVLVVFFAETFERILSFSIFLDCFGMATSAATIFVLRKRTKELDSKVYKIRWFPLVPLFFIAAYVFVAVVIAMQTPAIAATGMVVMLLSVLLYFIIVRKKK